MRNFEIKVNSNAATLVIVCIVKMQEILLQICKRALEMTGKITSQIVRKIYCTCAKMYVSDMVLYAAMLTPDDDIFYQDASSESWKLVMKCFEQHQFKNSSKILKAYGKFHEYLAIGNCVMNRISKNDNLIQQMFKQSIYGTYYFFNSSKT